MADKNDVVKKILRTKPAFPDDIPAFFEYARLWSGGADAQFLKRVQLYTKQLRKVERLPGNLVQALSDADMGKGLGGRFRAAALMCKATSNTLNPNHVKPSQKTKTLYLLAEKHMESYDHAIADLKAKYTEELRDCENLLVLKSAEHDMQCVYFAVGAVKKFPSLREISAASFSELVISAGLGVGIENPFKDLRRSTKGELQHGTVQPNASATTPSATAQGAMQHISGNALDAKDLRAIFDAKFKIGDSVTSKHKVSVAGVDATPGVDYLIVEVDATSSAAILTERDGPPEKKRRLNVAIQNVLDNYVKTEFVPLELYRATPKSH